MKQQRRVIYDNYDVTMADYSEFFKEFEELNEVVLTEQEKWELYYDELELSYKDEKLNLNKRLDGKIIAIADLGLWNGRKSGYKILDNKLNSILNSFDCDYMTVYADRYNVKSTLIHHDGTNYITFRMLRPELTDENIERFTDKLLDGTATDRDIRRYTLSIREYISKIYGF